MLLWKIVVFIINMPNKQNKKH